jgi:hypothetical protein
MAQERFSKRFGLAEEEKEPEITIRDEAPFHIRSGILSVATKNINLSSWLIHALLCDVLKKPPAQNGSHEEFDQLFQDCPWYNVYDFVEAVYHNLAAFDPGKASYWARLINKYFVETGVGWRLVQGQLERRGPEGFKVSVDSARQSLQNARLPTAHDEIHEAMRDLSRRPDPDLTGAIHHAMGALECTARTYTGEVKATLGDILKKYSGLVPKPLDNALSQAWGYASEIARHVREGRKPTYPEAELIVGVAAAVCTYLAAKIKKP